MAEFKNILLSEIRPDPNNPRQIFDDHSMKELTASVLDKGILQPIRRYNRPLVVVTELM